MCELCAGDKISHCSGSDPYANFDGAFKCLINEGDVAFLKHTTIEEMTESENYNGPSKHNFKLLCPNGFTANIDSYKNCNWGYVSAHAVVTTSAASPRRKLMFQKFLSVSFNFHILEYLSKDFLIFFKCCFSFKMALQVCIHNLKICMLA